MTPKVHRIVVAVVVFNGPQLFAAQRRPGSVDSEPKRLCGQVLAVLVDESDLPRRRLSIILERRSAAAGRQLAVHRHPVQHDGRRRVPLSLNRVDVEYSVDLRPARLLSFQNKTL